MSCDSLLTWSDREYRYRYTGIHIYIIYPYIYILQPHISISIAAFIVKFSWSFFPPRPDGRIEVELVLEGVPGEGGAEIEWIYIHSLKLTSFYGSFYGSTVPSTCLFVVHLRVKMGNHFSRYIGHTKWMYLELQDNQLIPSLPNTCWCLVLKGRL